MNTTTNKFLFNSPPLKFTPFNGSIDIPSEHPMFKYAGLEYAKSFCNEAIKEVINSCPLIGGFDYQLLDIKIHELSSGECPCIFGWHLDGTPDPIKGERSYYHLFLIGEEDTRTLFLKDKVELSIEGNSPQEIDSNYKKQLARKLDYFIAPEKTWITFTNEHFHSGPIAKSNSRRLLIRIAETNAIKPRNRIVDKSYVEKHENL